MGFVNGVRIFMVPCDVRVLLHRVSWLVGWLFTWINISGRLKYKGVRQLYLRLLSLSFRWLVRI